MKADIEICPRCGGSGKIDWIDYARGKNRGFSLVHSVLLAIMKQTNSYNENPALAKNIERNGYKLYPETDQECPNCNGLGTLNNLEFLKE